MANMAQAIRMALHYAEENLGVTDVFGEDVGPPLGGAFTVTQGLKTAWNSPLDERGTTLRAMATYSPTSAANALIKRDNPDISDDQLAYSAAKMKEYGIVDSGDSLTLGIGAMRDARVKSFFAKMVEAGLFKPELDYKRAYTLQFVGKGVGIELRPRQ